VRLLPLRVLGKCGGSTVDILAAMRWAVGIRVPGIVPETNPNPARVLNMSLGSECTAGTSCTCGTDYVDAVAEVTRTGALVVIAAGNGDGGPVGEPGNCPGAATVAAIRHLGTKVGFSDIGPEVALAAPGGNCVNTGLGQPCLYPVLAATNTGSQGPLASAWFDSFNFEVGTSLSTPLVAGVAALMFSKQPALTPAETLVLLKTTARPFPSTGAGNGINGQPVPKCTSPSIGVVQDQCYCPNDGPLLCGAGMLNAGAALAAAAVFAPPPVVTVSATNAQPTAGTSVTLTATATPASGRTIASYAWQITAGSGFASLAAPTNAASVTLAASAAGSVTVQVTVVDSGGGSTSQTQVLTVQAAPVVAVPNSPGSGGGGTVSWAWLLGMTLAVAGLAGGGTGRRG
jgi:serine protease